MTRPVGSLSEWPSYSKEEADAVARVLLSNKVNYWTGNECREFEREYAEWTGSQYAIAVANGSLALEAALRALKIGPGDEVVVTPRSFIASVSSVILCGATPIFADVEQESQNLSARTIEPVLTERTRAVLLVHHAGWPCDMDPIADLAEAHGLAIVEDCAQAHGARYKGKSVGTFGQVGAWSFCQDKIITTGGEGGMVTTSDQDLWSAMWSYKDHGKNASSVQLSTQHRFRWVHDSFGSNWRLTEMQSAIGRYQLRRLADWHSRRSENAKRLAAACRECNALRTPIPSSDFEHAWYKFYTFVVPSALKANWSRDKVLLEINDRGVPCFSGSCPEIYLEKAFDGTGFRPKHRLPTARSLGETSLMFLVHPTLSAGQVGHMCEVITETMSRATR